MSATRRPSGQAIKLLAAFLSGPAEWRYGYELTKSTGVGAGTLYPLLDRWASQGLLQSEWRTPEIQGRPPRHAYRLTADGVAFARKTTEPAEASPVGAVATG